LKIHLTTGVILHVGTASITVVLLEKAGVDNGESLRFVEFEPSRGCDSGQALVRCTEALGYCLNELHKGMRVMQRVIIRRVPAIEVQRSGVAKLTLEAGTICPPDFPELR
jgi:hypothetical protein